MTQNLQVVPGLALFEDLLQISVIVTDCEVDVAACSSEVGLPLAHFEFTFQGSDLQITTPKDVVDVFPKFYFQSQQPSPSLRKSSEIYGIADVTLLLLWAAKLVA